MFTAQRQDLHSIFLPRPIFDLDDNFLAENSTELFKRISSVSMRGAGPTIIDSSVSFWTGTTDWNGTRADVTCGDFTGGAATTTAGYGRLYVGIFSGTDYCNSSHRLLCVASAYNNLKQTGQAGGWRHPCVLQRARQRRDRCEHYCVPRRFLYEQCERHGC